MAKAPDEFYYGIEPPEEEAWICAVCGGEVVNDDYQIGDSTYLCGECGERWYDDKTIADFWLMYPGSLAQLFKDAQHEEWFTELGDYTRITYRDELLNYLL